MSSMSIVQNKHALFSKTLPLLLIGLLWTAYLVTYSSINHTNWGWALFPITNNGFLIVLAVSLFALWQKAQKASMAKHLFCILFVSRLFVFGDSSIYLVIRHLLHLDHLTQFWSSIDDALCIVGMALVALSLLLILFSTKINTKKTISMYIPAALFVIMLIGISFYAMHPSDAPITVAAWSTSIYAVIEKTLEITCIITAAVCLVTAKNKGVFYLVLGLLIGVATEMILAFNVFSQEYGVGSIFESGFILRNLLMLYGLVLLSKSKDLSDAHAWTAAPDTARGQAAYWFAISTFSTIILAVAMAKIFIPGIFNQQLLPFLPPLLIMCIIFAAILSNIAAKKFARPFQNIKALIDEYMRTENAPDPSTLGNRNLYLAEFKELRGFLIDAFNAIQAKRKVDKECFLLASQVAHDICSPLAALDCVLHHSEDMQEELRIMLRGAATNIRGITQNILKKYKDQTKNFEAELSLITRQPLLISLALMQALPDKRYQCRHLPISFDLKFGKDSRFAFIDAVPSDFNRMMSNILNNAVDALEKKEGNICVRLDIEDRHAKITIQDNGKGMLPEVAAKIMNDVSVTSGKADGHGLGFTQIREALKKNDGKMTIASELGKGTTITLTFPNIETAPWLATKIEVHEGDMIVIVDDDFSIHATWDERFKNYSAKVSIRHFQSGHSAIDFINGLGKAKNKVFLLTDYELLKQNTNGIKIIESVALPKSRALLVTSHYDTSQVRGYACSGTKILPKPLVAFIPITVA